MLTIKMSDWSTYPVGSTSEESPSNSFTCRNYFIIPTCKLAERTNQVVEIDISGVNYSASWLEGVFKNLNNELSESFLKNKLHIVYDHEHDSRYRGIIRSLIVSLLGQ